MVQDPKSAPFPSMPENALRATHVDYCAPLEEIAPLLVKLAREEGHMRKSKGKPVSKKVKSVPGLGAAPFVCPECSGPLFQVAEGPPGQLACLVGHTFAPESLSESHRHAVERALLTTMRLLEERARVHKHLAQHGQNGLQRQHFDECAEGPCCVDPTRRWR